MNTQYSISTEEFEIIEQYLLDKTTPAERQRFERQIQTDDLLAAKVEEVRLLLAGIDAAALKERLNTYHLEIEPRNIQKKGAKIIPFKLLLAASVFLFAVLSIWLFAIRGNRYEKIYAAYYKPDPGLMTAMGASDNYAFNRAMVDYKTGNYKKAIDAWSKLKNDMPASDTLNYFLGAARQANGNSKEALILLKQVVSDTAKPFYKDACWYTGLALLKEGAVKEAIPYLKKSGRPETDKLINKIK